MATAGEAECRTTIQIGPMTLRSNWAGTEESFRQQLIEIAIILVCYGVYLWTNIGKTINQHLRKSFLRCRSFLDRKQVLTKWKPIQEDACVTGPAWRLLPLSFAVLLALIVGQVLFEGNIPKAMHLACLDMLYTYFVLKGTYRQVEFFGRVLFLHQFVVNWYDGTFAKPSMIIRPVTMRCVALVMFFEHTDESLLQMLMFTWAIGRNIGWTHPLAFMPVRMFLLFLLPVRWSGIREWICSQDTLAWKSWESKQKLMLAFIIPLITMIFSRAVEERPQDLGVPQLHAVVVHHLVFLKLFGGINVIVFIVCQFYHDPAATTMMGTSVASEGESSWPAFMHSRESSAADPLTSVEVAVQPQKNMNVVLDEDHEDQVEGMAGAAMRLTLTDVIFILTATIGMIHVIWNPLLLSVLPFGLSRLVFSYRRKFFKSFHRYKLAVFYFHALVVTVVCALQDFATTERFRLTLVALTTVRMLFVFEKRSFVRIQKKLALLSIITCFICHDDSLVLMLFFLSLCVVVASVVIQQSRAESARVLARENDSQAFLSHAVKQKYSGVANAVENVLSEAVNRDKELLSTLHLLENVLQECRRGQSACHGLSLTRNVMLGKPRPKPQREDLRTLLERKIKDGALSVGQLDFQVQEDEEHRQYHERVPLEMDFELLEIFLMRWGNGSQRLEVKAKRKVGRKDVVELHFKRHLKGIVQESPSLPMPTNGLPRSASFVNANSSGKRHGGAFVYKNHPTNTLFLKELNGRFVNTETNADEQSECIILAKQVPLEEWIALNKPLQTKEEKTASWLASSVVTPSPTLPQGSLNPPAVPRDLVFAVLDDNLLVRKNLERIIAKYFQWNKVKSFTSGGTFEEAIQFPQAIADSKVDIAIFDENLEFEPPTVNTSATSTIPGAQQPSYLRGTELARLARDLGFNGCMILHSADAELDGKAGREYNPAAYGVTSSSPFDGYICKTTSHQEFIQGVARGWEKYQVRLRTANQANLSNGNPSH